MEHEFNFRFETLIAKHRRIEAYEKRYWVTPYENRIVWTNAAKKIRTIMEQEGFDCTYYESSLYVPEFDDLTHYVARTRNYGCVVL